MYPYIISVPGHSEITDQAHLHWIKTERPRGSEKRKLAKALVDMMAKIRLMFHEHARSVIELSYSLLPDLMGEIDEVAYKSKAIRLLLLDNNFLHNIDLV